MNTNSTQSKRHNRKKKDDFTVIFRSQAVKSQFMDAAKKNGPFFLHQINPANASELTSTPSRIYFSHDLTPFYQNLLYEGKQLKKNISWSLSGTIFML
jgi:hypothetical protein